MQALTYTKAQLKLISELEESEWPAWRVDAWLAEIFAVDHLSWLDESTAVFAAMMIRMDREKLAKGA